MKQTEKFKVHFIKIETMESLYLYEAKTKGCTVWLTGRNTCKYPWMLLRNTDLHWMVIQSLYYIGVNEIN